MNAIELLRSSRDELLRSNPEAEHGISIGGYLHNLEVDFHGVKTYADACKIMRRFGVQKWNKFPHDGSSYITGNVAEGLEISVFFDGLPPTCHKEQYVEKVPKTQTVDTGEFIEVTKTRIVCSDPAGETKTQP